MLCVDSQWMNDGCSVHVSLLRQSDAMHITLPDYKRSMLEI